MKNRFEFHLGQRIYFLQIRIGFGLLCVFFVILFSTLGVWQIHRYDFKKNLLDQYQHGLNGSPKTLSEVTRLSTDALQFQPVKVKGEYQNALTIFVQNRVYHDQLGYEVLTPLRMSHDSKLLLVDRGWVPKPAHPAELPSLDKIDGEAAMTGYLKMNNEYQFILGDNLVSQGPTATVIQRLDMKEISQIAHQAFYPFILRLHTNAPHGFVREWTITAVQPERHLGYAVQWFAMALTLIIAYFCFCIERVKYAKE